MKHGQKRRNRKHPGVRVMQLASGAWVGRWNDPVGGALRQFNLDAENLTNAERRTAWAVKKSGELAELRAAVALGTVVPTRTTIKDAVADYLAGLRTESTKTSKRVPLESFADWAEKHGATSLPDLAGPRLMRWRDHVLSPKRDHQPSTRNRWLVTTGIFLRWCLGRGLAPLLTSDAIRMACCRAPEPHRAIEFLRPPELRALLAAALKFDEQRRRDWRIAPVVMALLLSGCRFAELAMLTWNEVALDAGEIRLDAARTKTRRARVISCRETPTLIALLKALHEKRGEADRVFPGLRHPMWEVAHLTLIAECKAPKFSAHALRRSCGTVLTNAPGIYSGASAWHSAKRLGHGVEMAERCYAGQLRDLPATASTLEDAAGIRDLCEAIVAAAKGE